MTRIHVPNVAVWPSVQQSLRRVAVTLFPSYFPYVGKSRGEYLGPRGCEGLHNEKLNSLYHSRNIIRVIKSRRLMRAGHIARMEESRSGFKILTGKPTGNIYLGRLTCIDGREICFKEIYIIVRNWVDLAQDKDYWSYFSLEYMQWEPVIHGDMGCD